MLVLAVFIPICAVSVLFLLRFLFALNSELKSTRGRAAAKFERTHDLSDSIRSRSLRYQACAHPGSLTLKVGHS